MRILFIILAVGILLSCGTPNQHVDYHSPMEPTQPEMLYNTLERRWEFIGPDYELRYNDLNTRKGDDGEWSYVSPNSQLRYNDLEEEWQWAPQ